MVVIEIAILFLLSFLTGFEIASKPRRRAKKGKTNTERINWLKRILWVIIGLCVLLLSIFGIWFIVGGQ